MVYCHAIHHKTLLQLHLNIAPNHTYLHSYIHSYKGLKYIWQNVQQNHTGLINYKHTDIYWSVWAISGCTDKPKWELAGVPSPNGIGALKVCNQVCCDWLRKGWWEISRKPLQLMVTPRSCGFSQPSEDHARPVEYPCLKGSALRYFHFSLNLHIGPLRPSKHLEHETL